MTSPTLTDAASESLKHEPVIAVMLSKASDSRVLVGAIEHSCVTPDPANPGNIDFDLCIIDLKSLLRFQADLREIRSRTSPALKPVLLVASESELKKANSYLGDLAEDVIRAPIRRIELSSRIQNLLRLARLSELQQLRTESTKTALRSATRALQAFSACNERVIRARSEREMLSHICDSLVRDGGFALACIGDARAYRKGTTKPLAIAGDASGEVRDIESSLRARGSSDQDPIVQSLRSGVWRQQTLSLLPSGQGPQIQAVIAFPLVIRGREPEAYLAIYSRAPDVFDDAEVRLLQRMVDNIVHGIRALRDQSRRRRSEKRAHDMAYRDSLTGLANRAALLEALDRHLRLAGPFPPAGGILYLDLDGFKLINDALGHDAGDEVLVQVARRLEAAVRDSDLVARQGGDEFIILAPYEVQNSLSTVESPELMGVISSVAERVLATIEQPFLVRGREYHLGASIGISLCPHHASDASALLARADSAMYQAKKIGGNSFQFFSCELSKKQQRRLDLENRLHSALEAGEFQLVYQPLVDLTTTAPIGVEALIRWPQDDGSFISPGEFIPIAEETGLINPIGNWVMAESLAALQRWHSAGHDHLQMSVNLAIGQLWQPGLVQGIVDLLEQRQLPPTALKVELTEGSLMSDVRRMEAVVREFRQAEIEVAIDDFGTGYSSLARLRSLPITTLKIDRSFLSGTPDDESAVKMVNTIRQMAESLGIQALAEGIETEEQWRMLQALGCPLGQGFYFARPIGEPLLLEMLQTTATPQPAE
ncbi:putative bifunctional diguanylate cyclase/phosphodiesterase [Marinobacter sp.]|uniref:putative bifunctional diguanylate cyclase/phosphodiesterase n=1 Tax=Marinobacter sp. TaxID=50741 RepID=UPI0035C698D9